IHVEQERLKETVGCQDQVLAAYGGLNHITFAQNGEVSLRPVTLSMERIRELNSHLMLFFTGMNRIASTIADTYVNNIAEKEAQMRAMLDMVEESIASLKDG